MRSSAAARSDSSYLIGRLLVSGTFVDHTMNIHRGFSRDAIHWEIDPKPIEFTGDPDVTKATFSTVRAPT